MGKKRAVLLNALVSIVSQAIILVFGLIVPRVILVHYGSDINGLTSTITQVFTYMALMEAGISTASRNAIYKPIQENDQQGIENIVLSSQKYYRRVAIYYAIVVVAIAIILPFVLKTSVDFWTIFFVVIFEGLSSIVSFCFLDSLVVMLNASGKNYVVNAIDVGSKSLAYIAKIVLAIYGVNIAYIQLSYFLVSLIKVLLFQFYAKKKYPWLDLRKRQAVVAKLPERGHYVVIEVAWTIFSSTDMILLSLFVSTSLASVYSIYNLVFLALSALMNSLYTSLSYRLGLLYQKDLEEYKKAHDIFNSFFMALVTTLMCVCYWLVLPFVKLYTAGVQDINYIHEWLPLFFCLVQILSWSRMNAGNLCGYSGHAKEIAIVSVIEAVTNIALSLALIFSYSIEGVVLATVCSLPIKVVYSNWLAEHKIMHRSPWKTIAILLVNYALFSVTVVVQRYIPIEISSYGYFIAYGLCFTLGYAIVVYGVNMLINKDLFRIFRFLKPANKSVPVNSDASAK